VKRIYERRRTKSTDKRFCLFAVLWGRNGYHEYAGFTLIFCNMLHNWRTEE
jgi:hypothetical protein